MNKYILFTFLILSSIINDSKAQWNFTFNYNSAGTRVALVEAVVSTIPPAITLYFIDSSYNSSNTFEVSRRPLHGNGSDWVLQSTFTAGTGHWTDTNVSIGDVWEYQVKRDMGTKFATGYVSAGIEYDQSTYKGRMIVLIDSSMKVPLVLELEQLKRDLTGEGWLVEEIYTARAAGWYSADTVINVKQQIQDVWNAAPLSDKPSHLFIVGHVPVPRSGMDLQAPDGHVNSNGAVGSDTYYADLDGVFTDDSTYAPAFVLYDPNAYNQPNDFKWDQDKIPSELELAFGRIDFFEIGSYADTEVQLLKNYLNRLHDYRHVVNDMGEKTAFNLGYANSYDGSYRSLIPISGADSVYLTIGVSNYPAWVKANGPFQTMLRNIGQPSISNWDVDGMDATVFASDQSYWGQWSMPETGSHFAKIRALLAADSKCLVALWQSTAITTMFQPGIGETMGMSCKRIMDHNVTNNNIEKPEQAYNKPDFWNRTHMQYHGDPAVRLFQVYPISNLTQVPLSLNQLELNWTASIESNIVGYNIYKSATEFGEFQKINTSLIFGTNYVHTAFSNSNEWYMVRAIKLQTTGSGTYLNPSIGISIQSSYLTEVAESACDSFTWVNNTTYNISDNSAIHTFPNDSMVLLDLTINYSNTGIATIQECDSFTWDNNTTYIINNNTDTYTYINVATCDSIVTLDLTINSSTSFTDTRTECSSFEWIDNITYTSNNNTATATLINSENCDSVVTLDLSIIEIDASVSQNGFELSANANDLSYQWVDCDDNNIAISGETNKTFTATQNGNFAVIVSSGTCSEMSSCKTISGVAIDDFNFNTSVKIYPNPTTGIIYIESEENISIEITNTSGQIVESIISDSNTIDLSKKTKGIYFIKVISSKVNFTQKIILK